MDNILQCLEFTQILFKSQYGRGNDVHIYLSSSNNPLVERYNQNWPKWRDVLFFQRRFIKA